MVLLEYILYIYVIFNMTKAELLKFFEESLSVFFKKCPLCNSTFKDVLDNLIICKNCQRDQKINEILKWSYI